MSEKQSVVDADAVRTSVAESYTARVAQAGGCGCGCGDSGAKSAGYTADDLSRVPESAAVPSFGCGNPLAFSEVRPGQTVLDLGSGAGLDLLIAAEKVGPEGRVIGVDMTEAMVDRARRNVAAAGLGQVEVRQGLIEALPVESGSVDWVISNCVINLSPEKERVFAEIARVLRPGGRMLVSDIVAENLPEWLRASVAAHAACVGGALSEAEYLAGLRAAGLTEVAVIGRHDFGEQELRAVAASEGLASLDTGGAGAASVDDVLATPGLNVASIKVSARKPSCCSG
ncbi:MAG: arsenite methyltransferase [Armatimonadetes bacterium]|nr:arsenite methyltransferase [Armatimonadota bacterium]